MVQTEPHTLVPVLTCCLLLVITPGCGPSLRSANPDERIAAIAGISDPQRLIRIARDDRVARVRAAAIHQLRDDTLLTEFAIDPKAYLLNPDEVAETCREAVFRIRDPANLGKVAAEAKAHSTRKDAISCLEDDVMLLNLAEKFGDRRLRKAAVERISDQDILVEIATSNTSWLARRVAVDRLADDEKRADYLIRCLDLDMAPGVIERLEDSTQLARVAVQAEHWMNRRAAVVRITDPESLRAIAASQDTWEVRTIAMDRISDPDFARDRAGSDPDPEVRISAVNSLDDPLLLRQLAETDPVKRVRVAATLAIRDPAVLRELLDRDDPDVQLAAAAGLCEVVPFNDPFWKDLYVNAGREYRDHYYGRQTLYINGTAQEFGTAAAVNRTMNQEVLAHAAENDSRDWMRQKAIRGLEDLELLNRIATTDGDWWDNTQRAARQRLAELGEPPDLEDLRNLDTDDYDESILRGIDAVAGLDDQDSLQALASDHAVPVELRVFAISKLTDCTILARLLDNQDSRIASPATNRLLETCDEEFLFQFLMKQGFYRASDAIQKITNQDHLVELALRGPDDWTRLVAIKKVEDQAVLAEIALGKSDMKQRTVAARRVRDPEVLEKLIAEPYLEIRAAALISSDDPDRVRDTLFADRSHDFQRAVIESVEDDDLMKELFLDEPEQAGRYIQRYEIKDDVFWYGRYEQAESDYERDKALERVSDPAILAHIVEADGRKRYREAAMSRLRNTSWTRRVDIEAVFSRDQPVRTYQESLETELPFSRALEAQEELKTRTAAVALIADQTELRNLALTSHYDVIREEAVRRLRSTDELVRVAIKTSDRGVSKLILARIRDPETLETIASKARLISVRLAAEVKLGRTTWSDLIAEAGDKHATPERMGDVLGGISLVPHDESISPVVVEACHNYIRRGDASRIPDLRDLLFLYGNRTLAEDYLNCGNARLGSIATEWAHQHGYNIDTGPGSSRVRWGSQY
ncbi:MAG: hypothetical protein R3F07_11775 [Opitutaceae bacterium]